MPRYQVQKITRDVPLKLTEKHKIADTIFSNIDTLWQAELARATLGISPSGVNVSLYSWLVHLLQAPGKMADNLMYPFLHVQDFASKFFYESNEACCSADPRFRSENWNRLPWRLYAESFLAIEQWWKHSVANVPGIDAHDERVMIFATGQILDALCPSNFPITNPDLSLATLRSGGSNLVHGAWNALNDMVHLLSGSSSAETGEYKVGKNLAVTPGEVVFRNDLIELIRYAPKTKTVYKEPILILPAWILKYYILDLSPNNSLVRWLVEQGHTVFMVSWKNPTAEDAGLGMNEYYRLGAMAAIDAISKIIPQTKIHLAGYCLGGTLALITAAAMIRNKDHRIKTLSLFAAQGDFTDAGELMLFVTPSEVSFIKNMMKIQGYLDTKQMAGTFQMLRSYDLIWSKMVSDYLEGKRRAVIDLMVWSEDTTRMPYKMHSQYLEHLFLNNDLAEGRFTVEGDPVAAENIRIPIFAVSTEKDHVAPWLSVYKIHLMTDSDVTFVLTSGGHNAGIVSEPGHRGRSFRIYDKKRHDPYLDPERWLEKAEKREGSWWIPWNEWLKNNTTDGRISPPPMGESLGHAPGTYVFQK